MKIENAHKIVNLTQDDISFINKVKGDMKFHRTYYQLAKVALLFSPEAISYALVESLLQDLITKEAKQILEYFEDDEYPLSYIFEYNDIYGFQDAGDGVAHYCGACTIGEFVSFNDNTLGEIIGIISLKYMMAEENFSSVIGFDKISEEQSRGVLYKRLCKNSPLGHTHIHRNPDSGNIVSSYILYTNNQETK